MSRSARTLVLAVSLIALTAATSSRVPAAQQVAVQTESSSVSQLLTNSEIVNLPTGQRSIVDILQTVPAGWEPLQPPPVPGVAPGATVSFPPGQEPRLYDDPSNGQLHWVVSGTQPQSGWVMLMPELSPAPPLPATLTPPATPSAPTSAVTSPAAPATASTVPTAAPSAAALQFQTTRQPSTDYGAGSRTELDTDTAGGVLEGRVYDPNNNLRDDTTYQYANFNGKKIRTGFYLWDFNPKGRLSFTLGLKYNVRSDLIFSDFTNFGLHGERTSEEIANYRTDGFELRDWKIGTHAWSYTFHCYKLPATSGSSTASQTPITPTNTSLGDLFPLDYHPGDKIVGSLSSSSNADNFKTVPGLSEYDSSIQTYTLPDGTPEWCRFKIGFQGFGYVPVRAIGLYSVQIPLNLKGPPSLQMVQIDPLPNLGPSSATFPIGNPVAAPTLPNNSFSTQFTSKLQYWTADYLIDLWNEAFDRENELDAAYAAAKPNWYEIFEMEYELYDCYAEIDDVESDLPTKVVVGLANGMAQDASDYNTWLSKQPNLTSDDQDDLKDSSGWAKFLSNEAGYASFLGTWSSPPVLQPFWTNPVLTQDKLGAVRGPFLGDPLDTHIGIGSSPINPIAATSKVWYFMPPPGLTAGQSNYTIDSPLFPETNLPVFYMTLTMGAADLNLHKGQSTTYFARLDIFNGSNSLFPSLFLGPPLYETDIIGSSELTTIQQAAPSSRTGFITFSVTNQSPGTITMQNQSRVLNASGFVPLGSNEIDGTLTARKDGSFSLLGVGRANLAPELGLGPGSTPAAPSSSAPTNANERRAKRRTYFFGYWEGFRSSPPLTSSPFMTDCSGTGSIPTAAAPANPTAPAPTGTTNPSSSTAPGTTSSTGTTPASSTAPASSSSTAPSPTEATNPSSATAPAPSEATTPTSPSAPQCMGPEEQELYDEATGNPTPIPVGNTPSTADIDAAKKRVNDAKAKLKTEAEKEKSKGDDANDAWNNAVSHVPPDLQAQLATATQRKGEAETDLEVKRSQFVNNPTVSTRRDFTDASRKKSQAEDDYYNLRQQVIDQFTPEARAAWQTAQAALDQATQDRAAAEHELLDAQAALYKLTQSATTK
ncbi:MAG: hypothetical protein WB341_11340 [Terracidiphilus sp.]